MTSEQLRIITASLASALAGVFIGYALGLNNAVESYAQAETVCLLDIQFQEANNKCAEAIASNTEEWNKWFSVYRVKEQ